MKETDADKAREVHNTIVAKLSPVGEALGSIGHQTFLNPENPNEFLAVDTWPDMESLQKFMGDPADAPGAIASMFEGQPDITVWVESGYDGYYNG